VGGRAGKENSIGGDMQIIDQVNKALASKKKGEKWVEETLPTIVDLNKEIKSLEKAKEEEGEEYKKYLKTVSEKYETALQPLNAMNDRLRQRIMTEYEGTDPIIQEGVGQLVFPESWGYELVDFSKIEKKFRKEVVDDKAIKAEIKAGVRNIKGIKIVRVRSLRVLTKVD
jgi:hypothetical protein